MEVLDAEDPLAVALVDSIRSGAVATVRQLLVERPGLAAVEVADGGGMTRTLLHIATDWPGHFPNGAAIVTALIDAGADVNARHTGRHPETPLHWAASSDDVEVLDALLDGGADMEADGAVIAGGTPLSDAVAFAQWNTAHRLVERGAKTPLREAAALGLADRVQAFCADDPPTPDEINQAFWYACHGRQLTLATYLLERGADLDWVSPWDGLTPLDAATRRQGDDVATWLLELGARRAEQLR